MRALQSTLEMDTTLDAGRAAVMPARAFPGMPSLRAGIRERFTDRARNDRHAIARAGRRWAVTATAAAAICFGSHAQAQNVIKIGIGTQNTTTNTVTGGIVIRELKLLEKHLPKTGKYAGVTYEFDWQNATSGPPITNGMMANRIHIGMMGDYPLLVAGATGQQTRNETQLIAIIAYNQFGAGNGVVVHKDSPYYELADLKGKNVSVPFGSAAHGMMLQAMQARGWPQDFWSLASQSPEVGTTNLQEKRIDGHGDFVPFAELLPFRGFARKIFDGAETKIPTFHGVVIRKDFGEKYPEIVVGYIKALMEANDWVRKNPKQAMEKIEEWTKIEKEVAYVFLGPSGIHARSHHQAEVGRNHRHRPWRAAEDGSREGVRRQGVGERIVRSPGLQGARARLREAEGVLLGLRDQRQGSAVRCTDQAAA
jgi:ABC-type nitrate/sulfonate/bicarbonate transport system substrate-binding protein